MYLRCLVPTRPVSRCDERKEPGVRVHFSGRSTLTPVFACHSAIRLMSIEGCLIDTADQPAIDPSTPHHTGDGNEYTSEAPCASLSDSTVAACKSHCPCFDLATRW